MTHEHEGAGSSKHKHLYQNIAFLLRKVKAILCKSANLFRKRKDVPVLVPICVSSCQPTVCHIGETEAV